MQPDLKKRLLDLACAPYRPTGAFHYHWARGKLAHDPIFPALIEQRVFSDGARVLDLGCGRGLLAAWCLAAEHLATRGEWPTTLPYPPTSLSFQGVELMASEAQCGNRALQPIYGHRVQLVSGDMRSTQLPDLDAIAILDVLHYIPHHEQDQLLDRIRGALGRGGVFMTRVGNAGSGWRFTWSQIVDTCICFARSFRLVQIWCRPLSAWIQALEDRGFVVQALPMSTGTPFSNVMLVCRVA